MTRTAFQDHYEESHSICYGCGRLNPEGLQIKSYWDGEESVCQFTPRPYHTAMAGFVYGGLIASVIDCHGTGTASAAVHRAQNLPMGSAPELRFVTASLHVDYLRPTPIDAPMELRGKATSIEGRKVVVHITVSSKGKVCAKGEVVAVQIPEHLR